jgi:hypothetical protein
MRIFIIAVFSILFVQNSVFAQTKLGLKFSPAFTSSRINLLSDTIRISNDASAFRFSLGLVVDYPLTETYIFSTGLFYIPKQVSISIDPDPGFTYKNTRETYNLQYLQIPLTLKLYTNELSPAIGIYFQVGGSIDINIFSEPADRTHTLITGFKGVDTNVILGMGGEYRAGANTVLFAGFSYQRGLGNIVRTTNPEMEEGFAIRNTVVMIDFGIKF